METITEGAKPTAGEVRSMLADPSVRRRVDEYLQARAARQAASSDLDLTRVLLREDEAARELAGWLVDVVWARELARGAR